MAATGSAWSSSRTPQWSSTPCSFSCANQLIQKPWTQSVALISEVAHTCNPPCRYGAWHLEWWSHLIRHSSSLYNRSSGCCFEADYAGGMASRGDPATSHQSDPSVASPLAEPRSPLDSCRHSLEQPSHQRWQSWSRCSLSVLEPRNCTCVREAVLLLPADRIDRDTSASRLWPTGLLFLEAKMSWCCSLSPFHLYLLDIVGMTMGRRLLSDSPCFIAGCAFAIPPDRSLIRRFQRSCFSGERRKRSACRSPERERRSHGRLDGSHRPLCSGSIPWVCVHCRWSCRGKRLS